MDPDGGADGPQGAVRTHEALNRRRREAGIALEQLWISYFELTGDASPLELDAYLHGSMELPPLQVDILRQAIVECADDAGARRLKDSGD